MASAEVDSREWTTCEWMCTSGYRRETCGRGAMRNTFGLSLCWQHEDAAFSHVVDGIGRGRYYRQHLEDIAEAVLQTGRLTDLHPMGGSAIDRLVRAEIVKYLNDVIERGHSPNYEFGDQLDTILGQRMQTKWGSQ